MVGWQRDALERKSGVHGANDGLVVKGGTRSDVKFGSESIQRERRKSLKEGGGGGWGRRRGRREGETRGDVRGIRGRGQEDKSSCVVGPKSHAPNNPDINLSSRQECMYIQSATTYIVHSRLIHSVIRIVRAYAR